MKQLFLSLLILFSTVLYAQDSDLNIEIAHEDSLISVIYTDTLDVLHYHKCKQLVYRNGDFVRITYSDGTEHSTILGKGNRVRFKMIPILIDVKEW